MSKKSYKRNQNRLYREIKRRIIAESRLLKPVRFVKCERKIETIKVVNIIPDYMEDTKEYIEFIKYDLAKQLVQKLIDDRYVKFDYFGEYQHIAEDEEILKVEEIEARIDVVKPWN